MNITRNKKGQYIYHDSFWSKIKYRFNQVFRILKLGSFCLAALAIAFYAGQFSTSVSIYAAPVVTTITAPAPVLDRIAKCESKSGQFNSKGDVVTNVNTNGTVDVGAYQINLSAEHIKQMAKMGINPFTADGNKQYAEYLYQNVGTGPWVSSANCWNK